MYMIMKKQGVRFFSPHMTLDRVTMERDVTLFHSLKDARAWGFKHLGKGSDWVVVNTEAVAG